MNTVALTERERVGAVRRERDSEKKKNYRGEVFNQSDWEAVRARSRVRVNKMTRDTPQTKQELETE